MPKITDAYLRNLPLPPQGQITYDDDGSPLKVRVSQGGAKTFIVMLGSGRRHTIGRTERSLLPMPAKLRAGSGQKGPSVESFRPLCP